MSEMQRARPRGEIGQGAEARCEADAFELADLDEFKLKAGFGDEFGFEAAGGAYETDFGGVLVAELARDGEGWDDVAAGASACDEDSQVQLLASSS